MRTHLDMVQLGELHGLAHVVKIRSVETTGDICCRYQRHQRFVIAYSIEAERLAHVAVDRGHSAALSPSGIPAPPRFQRVRPGAEDVAQLYDNLDRLELKVENGTIAKLIEPGPLRAIG